MAKYAAKPIEIEAVQYTGTDETAIAVLMLSGKLSAEPPIPKDDGVFFVVSHGKCLYIPVNTWLIKRADGQLEVKGPVIFSEEYELIEG